MGLTCDSLSNIHGVLTEVESYSGEKAGNGWEEINSILIDCMRFKQKTIKHNQMK